MAGEAPAPRSARLKSARAAMHLLALGNSSEAAAAAAKSPSPAHSSAPWRPASLLGQPPSQPTQADQSLPSVAHAPGRHLKGKARLHPATTCHRLISLSLSLHRRSFAPSLPDASLNGAIFPPLGSAARWTSSQFSSGEYEPLPTGSQKRAHPSTQRYCVPLRASFHSGEDERMPPRVYPYPDDAPSLLLGASMAPVLLFLGEYPALCPLATIGERQANARLPRG